MAATRYYSATDGAVIVFRATTREYQSAWFYSEQTECGAYPAGSISFSAISHKGAAGAHPAQEITKAEYEALVAAKVERMKAVGLDPARYTGPQNSWVAAAAVQREG